MSDLAFDSLFDELIRQWPESLDVEIENYGTVEGRPHYAVKGLFEAEQSILAAYLDTQREVLVSDLLSSMYIRMHDIAPDVEKLVPSRLDRAWVRAIFEHRIRTSQTIGERLDWRPEDHALVDAYFAANPPERLLAAE